jgi:hypothetical protein
MGTTPEYPAGFPIPRPGPVSLVPWQVPGQAARLAPSRSAPAGATDKQGAQADCLGQLGALTCAENRLELARLPLTPVGSGNSIGSYNHFLHLPLAAQGLLP